MRPETCRAWALANGFNIYATTSGTQCQGKYISVLPNVTDAPASACTVPCGGDPAQTCGGARGAYSLYQVISEPPGALAFRLVMGACLLVCAPVGNDRDACGAQAAAAGSGCVATRACAHVMMQLADPAGCPRSGRGLPMSRPSALLPS